MTINQSLATIEHNLNKIANYEGNGASYFRVDIEDGRYLIRTNNIVRRAFNAIASLFGQLIVK